MRVMLPMKWNNSLKGNLLKSISLTDLIFIEALRIDTYIRE